MKKLLVLLLVVALTLCVSTVAMAATSAQIDVTVSITAVAVSVTLNESTWPIGALSENGTADTGANYFIATNNSNSPEALSIIAGNSNSGNWTLADINGPDTFTLGLMGEPVKSLLTSQILSTSVAHNGTVTFGLVIKVPSETNYGGVVQTIPVTVTASR
jgi:hypothetical protein